MARAMTRSRRYRRRRGWGSRYAAGGDDPVEGDALRDVSGTVSRAEVWVEPVIGQPAPSRFHQRRPDVHACDVPIAYLVGQERGVVAGADLLGYRLVLQLGTQGLVAVDAIEPFSRSSRLAPSTTSHGALQSGWSSVLGVAAHPAHRDRHRRHLAHRAPGIRPGCTRSTRATLDGQLAQRCALTPVHKTILGALNGPEPPQLFDVTPTG